MYSWIRLGTTIKSGPNSYRIVKVDGAIVSLVHLDGPDAGKVIRSTRDTLTLIANRHNLIVMAKRYKITQVRKIKKDGKTEENRL